MAGHVSLSPRTRFARIDVAADSTEAVIEAVAGYRICVMNYQVVLADLDGTYEWFSGSDSLSGDMPAVQAGGGNPSSNDPRYPLFVTAPGEALNLAAVGGAAKGHLTCYLQRAS